MVRFVVTPVLHSFPPPRTRRVHSQKTIASAKFFAGVNAFFIYAAGDNLSRMEICYITIPDFQTGTFHVRNPCPAETK